jgi:glycosyltransferase involved in cell wall biosynthesis
LQRKVSASSRKSPLLVPNGLSEGVAVVDEPRTLERGRITIGYFGYLAEAWFDWDLLVKVAYRNPDWHIYLIGYGGTSGELSIPDNLHMLGKVPRHELAAYAANWDVAIVPFKEEAVADRADPIKTYEYMAMGLPVVLTGVHPPQGTERLLRRVEGVYAFEEAIRMEASEKERLADVRIAFARRCTWTTRMDQLLGAIEDGAQRIGEKHALFGVG